MAGVGRGKASDEEMGGVGGAACHIDHVGVATGLLRLMLLLRLRVRHFPFSFFQWIGRGRRVLKKHYVCIICYYNSLCTSACEATWPHLLYFDSD